MSYEIYGPFGEIFHLRSVLDGGMESELLCSDEVMLTHYLHRLLEMPGNREVLRQIAMSDPLAPSRPMNDYELLELLARRLSMGTLALTSSEQQVRWEARGVSSGPSEPIPEPVRDERPPPEVREHERDWWFHCSHHVSPYGKREQENRHAFGRTYVDKDGRPVTVIDVVPNFAKGNSLVKKSDPAEDELSFFWKDTELGSPPKPELFLTTAGKPEEKVAPAGNESGYTKYAFKTPYLGDQDIVLFFLPAYWRKFHETTQYRLNGGPQAVRVDVHHPRKFKLEFSMPPFKSKKVGVALGREAEGSHDPRKLTDPQNRVFKMEQEYQEGWGKSKLELKREVNLDTMKSSGGWKAPDKSKYEYAQPDAQSKTRTAVETADKMAKLAKELPIKYYRDGEQIDAGPILNTVATILRLYALFMGVIKTVKDYAPQAGFYCDFDLQLFSGALAAEWMWKEHEDHRAYQSLDVNLNITIIKVMLELGVGVKACGGKLQIYAQVEGALDVDLGYRTLGPDAEAKVPISTTAKITGAIGARLEAGNFAKVDGKGETGFQLKLDIVFGIGPGQDPFTIALTPTWTGIKFSGSVSVGAFGVSYKKSGEFNLVDPMSFEKIRWPEAKPYQPPRMSKHDIARVFKSTFLDGIDVLVYREQAPQNRPGNKCPNPKCPGHGSASDYCSRWSASDWKGWVELDEVCDLLAEKVMADKGFTQTHKEIEALANSVREDFRDTKRMAHSQLVGRNYVKLHEVEAYASGRTIRGCSFDRHLEEGRQDPLLNASVGA